MKKNKKILIITVTILAIYVIVFGISFAYFSANTVGNGDNKQLTVSVGELKIRYEDGTTTFSTIGDWEPGESVTKSFSIINDGRNTAYYKIYLDDVINTFYLKDPDNPDAPNELIYTLKRNGEVIVSEESNTAMLKKMGLLYGGDNSLGIEISSQQVDEYLLTIKFLELGTNQNYNQTKMFSAKVSLNEPIGKTLDSGVYIANANCSNGSSISVNNKIWGVEISNYKDDDCEITYSKVDNRTYLNEYIASLAITQSSGFDWINGGAVIEEHGLSNTTEYRYEGKEVNNYVWFNNELWRIIGVFDEASHGIAGENLVKIIRAESIGGISWDARGADGKTYTNNWGEASLNILLNEYYYKQRDNDDTLGNVLMYCHTYNNPILGSCNYNNIGISAIYRNMVVENAKWYLNGTSSMFAAKTFFDLERNGSRKNEDYPYYVEKPVGLMYISDYGYSAGPTCQNTSLSTFGGGCATKSWIYGQGREWTISHHSNTKYDYTFIITIGGSSTYGTVYYASIVRPAVYLKSNTYILSGDGSQDNPYVIGIGA